MRSISRYVCGTFVGLRRLGAVPLLAAAPPFDLAGPRIEIRITRAGRTLPISQVPNLQAGDQMWLRPDLPENESVHYLLIPVFLRGPLNPPPDGWFTKVETWRPRVRKAGVFVDVPEGALEALLLMAPDTGGGFTTVRSAVRSRPGIFVRAAQDLYAADLTRSRLDAYVDAVKKIAAEDPNDLQKRAKPLSRTLYLKINQACFDLSPEQQEACLVADPGDVVLNDAQSQSMVTALTSGAAGDMINQLSFSTAAGGGMYSPYVGAVVDMVRIVGSLHTAQYAYIPAIAVMHQENLALKLNSPPSFSNPKSVMISSLPPIVPVRFPSLDAVHPHEMLCLERPSLSLAVEGAPLVFSTGYAHDLVLRVQDTAGHSVELPATADAIRGGFIVDAHALQATPLTGGVTGQLRGQWGFDDYSGPDFAFTNSHPQVWDFIPGESDAVTAADKVSVTLQADSAVCVESVDVLTPQHQTVKADWKATSPKLLRVDLPIHGSSEGLYTIAVAQYGQHKPDTVAVHVYAPSAKIAGLVLHEGDSDAELTGSLLNEVASVELGGVTFRPARPDHSAKDRVRLHAAANVNGSKVLVAGAEITARVHLKDGRVLEVPVTIAPPRPRVRLLSKSIAPSSQGNDAVIQLGNRNDLPQSGRLTFFLKSDAPPEFSRDEKIEVAAANGGFDTTLSLADATLTLQDASTVLAVLDPAKAFGPSAFGQLRFRAVTGAGVNGDWQPLTSLVRLPSLKEVRCPASPDKPCILSGEDLFLIDSVANSQAFTHSVAVPMGFAGTAMQVPRPDGTTLYLKLRDDPTTVDMVALPVLPQTDSY